MEFFDIGERVHFTDAYTIIPKDGKWYRFYQDPGRGTLTYERWFDSEEEACSYYLEWISGMGGALQEVNDRLRNRSQQDK